jgi:hypothetical protein
VDLDTARYRGGSLFSTEVVRNRSPRPSLPPYSPKLIDGEVFSAVQLKDAERFSVRRVMSSSCSQPSQTKEYSSSSACPDETVVDDLSSGS